MAGGMGVQKNVHIENWAGFRENCEHVFRFSRGNIAKFLAFGVGVPLALYYGIVTDMAYSSQPGPERFGLERKYMGGPEVEQVKEE